MRRKAAGRVVRGSAVLILPLVYLSYVFRLFHETFWAFGLGDWMDPYFINALLEHWHQSLWRLTDPSSPPIFFPAAGTLGYSHGLVLYAPFYVPVRAFLHPFQAYSMTLLLVMEAGTVCLYLIFRKFLGLSFVEALLLCAFFLTSPNVINGEIAVWSQRASVFLIPPTLLALLLSRRMPDGRARLALAWVSGLLSTLLFTQDFYTAHLALLLSALAGAGYLLVAGPPRVPRMDVWSGGRSRAETAAFLTAALAGAFTAFVLISGGMTLQVFGVTIRSHDWRRPALVALAGLAVWIHLRGLVPARAAIRALPPWFVAFALGVFTGGVIFLWIYLPSYLEHPAFPEGDLMNLLIARHPASWQSPMDFLRDLNPYNNLRSFKLVAVLGMLAWVPWLPLDRRTRLYSLWFLIVTLVVLVIPIRFDDFSLWRTVFRPLPGFSAIRDPRRIIYLYELAVVIAAALFLARLPGKSPCRRAIAVLVLVLIATDWNRATFDFLRRTAVYDRWVAAPIALDPSCESFFFKGASREYTARSRDMQTLYGIDAMFVSLKLSLPTLNGYSAWSPENWGLGNPNDPGYEESVRRWIERHRLTGVCELDIEARRMRLFD